MKTPLPTPPLGQGNLGARISRSALVGFLATSGVLWLAFSAGMNGLWALVAVLANALGFLFVAMTARRATGSLGGLVGNLVSVAGRVRGMSETITTSSSALAESVTQASSSLQTTVTAINQISSMLARTASNAEESRKLASESEQAVKEGRESSVEVLRSIEDIDGNNQLIMKQIEENNRQLDAIVTMIAEISGKTAVINEIVFQTKLLSFNASVEAARAGEHGRGFAVVADEIGKLAEMSGKSANEISRLVMESSEQVGRIILATQQDLEGFVRAGKAKTESSTVTVRKSGEILDRIIEYAGQMAARIDEISGASQEQAEGVRGIVMALSEFDRIFQENTLTSGEAASSAEELRDQAGTLGDAIAALTEKIGARASVLP